MPIYGATFDCWKSGRALVIKVTFRARNSEEAYDYTFKILTPALKKTFTAVRGTGVGLVSII